MSDCMKFYEQVWIFLATMLLAMFNCEMGSFVRHSLRRGGCIAFWYTTCVQSSTTRLLTAHWYVFPNHTHALYVQTCPSWILHALKPAVRVKCTNYDLQSYVLLCSMDLHVCNWQKVFFYCKLWTKRTSRGSFVEQIAACYNSCMLVQEWQRQWIIRRCLRNLKYGKWLQQVSCYMIK